MCGLQFAHEQSKSTSPRVDPQATAKSRSLSLCLGKTPALGRIDVGSDERALVQALGWRLASTRLGGKGSTGSGGSRGPCAPEQWGVNRLNRSCGEAVLKDRVHDGLERCRNPVDENRRSNDRVAIDHETVAGHKLIVGGRVPRTDDRREVDGQDLLAARPWRSRPDQPDILRGGGGDQAARIVDGVEHGLVARDRHPAGGRHVALDVVDLAVIRRDVDEDPIRILGIDGNLLVVIRILGIAGSGRQASEIIIRHILAQVKNDLFLDLERRQTRDVNLAVEAEGDLAVRLDQSLA